jgi:hypothetical protein
LEIEMSKKMDKYSLKQTEYGNWYVAKNGQMVGDSRKFATKEAAVADAKLVVSRDPENRVFIEDAS